VVQESSSPWASPIVLVQKKDRTLCFCVDYRRLNAVTKKDVHPLPRIDDLLDQLSGKRFFSTLDARTGYWQIRMEEKSVEKTAFVIMDGLYEFRVMPFGLCNAPATFQRLMQKALRGLPFCSVFIDIIVFSDSMDAHLEHLKQVFDRLRQIRQTASSEVLFHLPRGPFPGTYCVGHRDSAQPRQGEGCERI